MIPSGPASGRGAKQTIRETSIVSRLTGERDNYLQAVPRRSRSPIMTTVRQILPANEMRNRVTIQLLSLQVGMPETLDSEKPWTSGIGKSAVSEPRWIGQTQIEGDGQADRVHHGGPHKAVCVYSADHYPYWREQHRDKKWPWGSFGENFTVQNLSEAEVCIGDIWKIGEAKLQVSQPRQPCWKLARFWDIKDLALQVQQNGKTGWYLRVLEEGHVQAGMPILLESRSNPRWTIAAANEIMHHDKQNFAAASDLLALPELSPSWVETLTKRVQKQAPADPQQRLSGNSSDASSPESE